VFGDSIFLSATPRSCLVGHMERVLLLANGSWDTSGMLEALLPQVSFVIAADGAWDQALARGIPVDAVIGDFDSTQIDPDTLSTRLPELHRFPADKDWTDLELALDLAIERGPQEIVIYGALGGRLDHTLANLALLARGRAHSVAVCILSGLETLRLVDDSLVLANAMPGDTVSLIPVSDDVRVSSLGLRYPLDNERLILGATRGVSNVVREIPASLRVHSGSVLVVHGKQVDRND